MLQDACWASSRRTTWCARRRTPTPWPRRGSSSPSVEDYADLGATLAAPSSLHVSDVLTPRVYSVNRDTGVAVAANIMRERRIHRLLVLDKGVLVGIVSSLDLLRVVEELC